MLGKLIKHEWKNTYRFGLLMLGAVALITFLGWLAFQTPMWNLESGRMSWIDLLGLMTLLMYVMLLFAAHCGVRIYVGVHFYRTMYTDEGYLVHTLPVTKHQILFSKILVGSLWLLFFCIATYLSYFILGVSMISAIMKDEYSLSALWREILPNMGDFLRGFGDALGLDMAWWLVKALVSMVVSPFVFVVTLFGAISLGQLFSRYRVMMAILIYIGILLVNGLLGSLFRSFMSVDSLYGLGGYLDYSTYVSSIVNLLMAVAMYFVSWYVTSRRLNMQ